MHRLQISGVIQNTSADVIGQLLELLFAIAQGAFGALTLFVFRQQSFVRAPQFFRAFQDTHLEIVAQVPSAFSVCSRSVIM